MPRDRKLAPFVARAYSGHPEDITMRRSLVLALALLSAVAGHAAEVTIERVIGDVHMLLIKPQCRLSPIIAPLPVLGHLI